jgi:hypothetical protein
MVQTFGIHLFIFLLEKYRIMYLHYLIIDFDGF